MAIYRTIWQEKGAFKKDFFDHTFAEASTLAGQADEECLKSYGDQVATPHSQGSRPEHGRFRHSTPSEEAPQRGPKRHRRKPLTAEQLDRRREQNRQSQKNYRQRKDNRISDLERELEETRRQNEHLEQLIIALQRQITSPSGSHDELDGGDLLTGGGAVGDYLDELIWTSYGMPYDSGAMRMESKASSNDFGLNI
ncbi:hypothetical protein NKR19_g4095 [Coniochaeta hoffmannii]|uniref:Putative transcription factor kapC n=1 Tax=Coniochaeta hoffmannii TaxID=91930 RepID=A0AA38VQ42_9PEZI|nr:hypothetical protein NKR19_g4095 [Coniochaeta hoffmannii]